jgi:DNA-binding CsgD family transcriptional regulator
MPHQPGASISCPILIGRDECVARFDAAFARVVAGEGRALAVSGEAGVGKSRLVKALVERARQIAPDVRVLQGNCFERDANAPFAPFVDMWRSFALKAGDAELRATFEDDAADLVRLLPELRGMLPQRRSASTAVEPEQEKRRLFQALLQPLIRMAREAPVLVVVEDLHWCDESSIEFLEQLARRARDLRIALLFTYRADEVGPSLAHFLAGLDRERLADEIALTRLSKDDVGRMLGAIFDGEPLNSDLVAQLFELTDGNPFFVEEVLKSLLGAGNLPSAEIGARRRLAEVDIPRSVQDAVQRRSALLSDEARRLLVLAAVAGRRFDLALLSELRETPDAEMLELIKELVAAQLVIEESADRFAFRHALTQQAIYTALLLRERSALHLEIARAMESGDAEAHLGDLAHHYYEAAAWDQAFEYSSRVGKQAQALFSPAAAVRHFSRALDAADRSGKAPPPWIYGARGSAHEALGDFARAREDHEAALRMSRAAADTAGEWQALIDLGFLWVTRDYERAGEFFRRALDLARASDDAAMLARSLNRLGNWLVNVGRPIEGIDEHRAALKIFTAAGDQQGIAETLDLMGMANGIRGDLKKCVEHYGRAIGLLTQLGDEQRLMSALASRTTYSSPGMSETVPGAGRTVADARADGEAARRLAERSGSSVGLVYAHWTLAATLTTYGLFGEGMPLADEALRLATEIDHQQWTIGARFTLGQALWLMLATDDAIAHLEAALPSVRSVKSVWWTANVSCYLALAHLSQADARAARRVLDEANVSDDVLETLPERRMGWARAELLLAEDAVEAGLKLVDRLLVTGAGLPALHLPPPLLVTRARALTALDRVDDARDALLQAEASAIAHGDLPWLWRAQCALSRNYLASGRRSDAEAKQTEARALLHQLAEGLDEERRSRFLEAAHSYLPPARPPTIRRAEKEQWSGLTAREREIAALVTRGRSNREIAAELVVSERTVETHIGNILGKLSFNSRSQIAVWGAERGLQGD